MPAPSNMAAFRATLWTNLDQVSTIIPSRISLNVPYYQGGCIDCLDCNIESFVDPVYPHVLGLLIFLKIGKY